MSRSPPNEGALAGITRQTLLERACAAGIETKEEQISRVDLFSAEEVFLTGSGAGVLPAANLDGQALGTNPEWPVFNLCSKLLHQARRDLGYPF